MSDKKKTDEEYCDDPATSRVDEEKLLDQQKNNILFAFQVNNNSRKENGGGVTEEDVHRSSSNNKNSYKRFDSNNSSFDKEDKQGLGEIDEEDKEISCTSNNNITLSDYVRVKIKDHEVNQIDQEKEQTEYQLKKNYYKAPFIPLNESPKDSEKKIDSDKGVSIRNQGVSPINPGNNQQKINVNRQLYKEMANYDSNSTK